MMHEAWAVSHAIAIFTSRGAALMMGIVASQCPSSRDAVLVMCYLTPLMLSCLNAAKQFYLNETYSQWICELNWQLWFAFDTSDWWIFHRRCRWLAWRVWWHALAFITHVITWCICSRLTHICVGNLTIIGSDNGLAPTRDVNIISTNAGILLIGSLGTKFSEISIGIQTFIFKKLHLKTSSAKWRLFCLSLNELSPLLLKNDAISCPNPPIKL